MTTKTVSAWKRLHVRGLALLGLVALAVGYAESAAAGSYRPVLAAWRTASPNSVQER